MKLKFVKDDEGSITLTVDGKEFEVNDYLQMIKDLRRGEEIELDEFEGSISDKEKKSIEDMISQINSIDFSLPNQNKNSAQQGK